MKHIHYFIIALSAIFLFSCKDSDKFLQSITGSPYEVLVVVEKNTWNSPSGEAVKNLLQADMPSLPQKEPYFSLSNCAPEKFSSLYKPTRNILFLEIDAKKYTKGSVSFSDNKWARTQALVRITAPDETTLNELLEQKGEGIINFLVKAELDRQKLHLTKHPNKKIMAMIQEQFGISITVPHFINQYKQGENMLWLSTGSNVEARQDIFIYTYPYTSTSMLTAETLLQKRDSVNKHFIPGHVKGSYVSTEYKYDSPIFKEIWVEDKYCAQLSGLWKTKGGSSMGGPFISHTRIDQVKQRVVTVEVFVYAPGNNKRNYIRQLEAVLYTVKLPVVLDDMVVTAEK